MRKIVLLFSCSCVLLTLADERAVLHDVLRPDLQPHIPIRGSAFNDTGLSLGGLTLRTPQTEHFNTELPLPAALLSQPTVLTGLDNQGGHLVGTVGVDLLPITGKKQIGTGFGSDHRDWQDLLVQHMVSETLGIGGFAGRESANGVDYDDNDVRREYLGTHLQHRQDDVQSDLIIAHQEKEFGARGYYGAPDTQPAQEKTEDTFLFLSSAKGDLETDYLRGGASWREFHDDYQLPDMFYRSQYRSQTASAFADGRTFEVNGWALGWRTDVEEENMQSASLGDHHRTRGGASLLPQWSADQVKITAGMRGEFFTDESPKYLPQLGIDYLLSDNLTAFASYSESVRLPSYTELNYNSPFSLGNSDLKPQTSAQTEVGLKGIPSETMDWKIAPFHRRSKNTIDWMQSTAAGSWEATNIGALNVYGVESRLGWYPAQTLEMKFGHTWSYKNKEASDLDNYASRYALDYPEQLVQAALLWRPITPLEIGTVQTLRWQTDNPVREHGNFGTDSSFVVRITPPRADYMTLSLLLNNAWDNNFQTFPGQRPPERFAGISLSLNF